MQQNSSLDFKLVQRVCLLQQALDQALDSLEEMRAQVQDKQWVEAQLANTEKYANVQQQAIAQLKQQLAQLTEVQRHLLGVMDYRLNQLMGQQQVEFSRLNIQLQQGETELQTYLQYLRNHCKSGTASETAVEAHCLELEAEVMIARSVVVSLSRQLNLAKQSLTTLTSSLDNHHLNLSYIIGTIQAMMTDLSSFDRTSDPPPLQRLIGEAEMDAPQPGDIPADRLQDTLRWQEARIRELETALMDHFSQRTQIKQRCQALAAERDYYKRELYKARQAAAGSADLTTDAGPSCEIDRSPGSYRWSKPRLRSQPPPPIQPLKPQSE